VRVLLTNDDGVDADGLLAIRTALTDVGTSVVTIAPESNCSGFARSCTFSRPVGVTRVAGGQHPVYRCDGTPADCVRVGLLGGLAAGADLVVSGINHGANLADDVTYSGTVGAGLEAAILGTPAVCLSQQTIGGRGPPGRAGGTQRQLPRAPHRVNDRADPGRAARLAARLGAGLGRRSRRALAVPVRRAG
jgi:5'-nucleotidase